MRQWIVTRWGLKTIGRWAVGASVAALLAGGAWANSGNVYVSSEKDNKLFLFNGKGDRLAEIPTCERPRHMMFSLDRKQIFVCCGNSNELGVVDVASNKMVRTMALGDSPEIFDFNADQSVIYVSIEDENVMAAYDMKTGDRLFDIGTAGEPEGIYLTANDKIAYVTSEVGNVVHVIDLENRKVLKDLQVGIRPRRFTPSADGKEVWVSNELSNSISVIDTATHTVKDTIVFKIQGMRDTDVQPVGMVLSKDGKTMWVGLGPSQRAAQVDMNSRKVLQLVQVGKRAWNVGMSPDGKTLYVVNGMSDDMTVVDVSGATARAIRTVSAGRVPHSALVMP